MIYYLAREKYDKTMKQYLDTWGLPIAELVQVVSYEELFKRLPLRSGCYIFSDLERLTPRGLEQAASIRMALEKSGVRVMLLNHPTRSMRRYELLRTLYGQSKNLFNVYRLTECRFPERYPVFIRNEQDHDGSLTGLLKSKEELEEAVLNLDFEGRCREDRLIVEYQETISEDGLRRKYGAFFINGEVIPRHVFFSRECFIKRDNSQTWTNELVQEELQYLYDNPHSAQIKAIFSDARIDYGRIDYGLSDGVIQTWEINTNPTIGSFQNLIDRRREQASKWFALRMNEEMVRLARLVE